MRGQGGQGGILGRESTTYERNSVLDVIGRMQQRELAAVAAEANAEIVASSSLKHIDRGYLNSSLVKNRSQELTIICKAWPVRNGKRFNKSAFTLDWDSYQIRVDYPLYRQG